MPDLTIFQVLLFHYALERVSNRPFTAGRMTTIPFEAVDFLSDIPFQPLHPDEFARITAQ